MITTPTHFSHREDVLHLFMFLNISITHYGLSCIQLYMPQFFLIFFIISLPFFTTKTLTWVTVTSVWLPTLDIIIIVLI